MPATHPQPYDENAPHQTAISALAFELNEAESSDDSCGYSPAELLSFRDSIRILCELRDGSARVTRPADGVL